MRVHPAPGSGPPNHLTGQRQGSRRLATPPPRAPPRAPPPFAPERTCAASTACRDLAAGVLLRAGASSGSASSGRAAESSGPAKGGDSVAWGPRVMAVGYRNNGGLGVKPRTAGRGAEPSEGVDPTRAENINCYRTEQQLRYLVRPRAAAET
jgi:hypothetical protein